MEARVHLEAQEAAIWTRQYKQEILARVKIFLELNLKVMDGDEAFYYLHKDGELKGAVQTHVNDFSLAGTSDFIDKNI